MSFYFQLLSVILLLLLLLFICLCWIHLNVLILLRWFFFCRWIMRTFKLSEILLGLLVHSIVKCMPVRPCPLSWHAAPRHSHMMRNVSGEEKFFYCENRNNDCDYGNNVSQEKKANVLIFSKHSINNDINNAYFVHFQIIREYKQFSLLLSYPIFPFCVISFCHTRNFCYHLFPFSISRKKRCKNRRHTHTYNHTRLKQLTHFILVIEL